ncbi:PREDICTED: uncharacterized protein LOC105976259 [Erythranthe guttata]|uniref:uncharacterized protein LOC105976259 n=1 Tax=Erythranthe guttata TaxID=4155 RepID=UPI00064D79E7|nr:PREDICTED: uncharacterized protein LOC105976259 [Erythranthe guttata]|eukprot:XP_012856991.1 PREDICTED: uncharacterized protein LOC105976259 [Erythranthe guttata]
MEKLVFALVTAARKLRMYFQSHHVVVLSNLPLKHIFSSPEASGRMVKWAVELIQCGLEYNPRPAIKAQVLADFLVEMAGFEESISTPTWLAYVDGSSTIGGSGIGIVLESPQGDKIDYAIKLDFQTSNNEAEYEAFITWIRLSLAAGARKLVIHSDSQLVVKQVSGDYDAKEKRRFGVPRALISDNGTQFAGSKLENWCEGLHIKHFFTLVYSPHANEQTEVTNRTILQHLKTRLGNAKGRCVEELHNVLWAYRTTPRSATGESPFSLAYGTEAFPPVEIGEPSWGARYYEVQNNEVAMRINLDLLGELMEGATARIQKYKIRMARAYNAKVRSRTF